MKKFILILSVFIVLFGVNLYASEAKGSVEKISENSIKIWVNSTDKIKVTGYTISRGSNIVIYYIASSTGLTSDSITIDLNTVVRPYRIILVDGNQPYNAQPFIDIENHQMRDYIRHMHDMGFIEGYEEDNTFRPDNKITRAEFITMMVRMLKLNENPESRKNFVDLDPNHWAYSFAIKAIDNGLIDGYDENNKTYIKLNNNITLAEASKIITDAFAIVNNSEANYDVRFVRHWAKDYIQTLVNENVISPNDDFYIKGEIDRPATRGEISMLLSRTLGR